MTNARERKARYAREQAAIAATQPKLQAATTVYTVEGASIWPFATEHEAIEFACDGNWGIRKVYERERTYAEPCRYGRVVRPVGCFWRPKREHLVEISEEDLKLLPIRQTPI